MNSPINLSPAPSPAPAPAPSPAPAALSPCLEEQGLQLQPASPISQIAMGILSPSPPLSPYPQSMAPSPVGAVSPAPPAVEVRKGLWKRVVQHHLPSKMHREMMRESRQESVEARVDRQAREGLPQVGEGLKDKVFVRQEGRLLTEPIARRDNLPEALQLVQARQKAKQAVFNDATRLERALHTRGYSTFRHAQGLEHGVITDLVTGLDGRDCTQMRFRTPAQGLQPHGNAATFLRQYPERDDHFDWTHSSELLSVDGDPTNQRYSESAYDFLISGASNASGRELTALNGKIVGTYISSPKLKQVFIRNLDALEKSLPEDQGRLYVIAIPKAKLAAEKSRYVYRSHPYGIVCDCQKPCEELYSKGTKSEDFASILEQDQSRTTRMDHDEHCECEEDGRVHQYRILAPDLDNDPSARVFKVDELNVESASRYRRAKTETLRLMRAAIRLQNLNENSTLDEVAFALRLPADQIARDPNMKAGFIELLQSKSALLLRHKEQLLQSKAVNREKILARAKFTEEERAALMREANPKIERLSASAKSLIEEAIPQFKQPK